MKRKSLSSGKKSCNPAECSNHAWGGSHASMLALIIAVTMGTDRRQYTFYSLFPRPTWTQFTTSSSALRVLKSTPVSEQ